jgi:hypothetical protein
VETLEAIDATVKEAGLGAKVKTDIAGGGVVDIVGELLKGAGGVKEVDGGRTRLDEVI